MTASYQPEETSTRFLLHNIDPLVDCTKIVEELKFARIKLLDARYFLRHGTTPTTTVLITKLGHSLPRKSVRISGICAESHRGTCAIDSILCVNYKGSHVSKDKSCPHYIRESKLKIQSWTAFRLHEAQRQFCASAALKSESYAAVASTPVWPSSPSSENIAGNQQQPSGH